MVTAWGAALGRFPIQSDTLFREPSTHATYCRAVSVLLPDFKCSLRPHGRRPNYPTVWYLQAKAVLDRNKAERHIRGGNATREKYREKRRRV